MGHLYDLNPFHPIIKFSHEFSTISIDLLDITVKFGLVEFFLHCTPLECKLGS